MNDFLDKMGGHPYNIMVREYVSGIFAPIFPGVMPRFRDKTGKKEKDCSNHRMMNAQNANI